MLPMAVQVSSVSFPSLTTSSRLSMIGLPGGTDTRQQQERSQGEAGMAHRLHEHTDARIEKYSVMLNFCQDANLRSKKATVSQNRIRHICLLPLEFVICSNLLNLRHLKKKKSVGCLFQGLFNATLRSEILQLGFNCTTRVITLKCS